MKSVNFGGLCSYSWANICQFTYSYTYYIETLDVDNKMQVHVICQYFIMHTKLCVLLSAKFLTAACLFKYFSFISYIYRLFVVEAISSIRSLKFRLFHNSAPVVSYCRII